MATNKETIELYGGEEEIIFYPDSHRYRKPGEKTYLVSTTAVTGIISPFHKINALKQWAVNVGCDHIQEYLDDIFFIEIGEKLEKKLKDGGMDTITKIKKAENDELLAIDGVEMSDVSEISRVMLLVSDAVTIDEMLGLVEGARYKHKEKLSEAASIGDELHAFAEEYARRRVEGKGMDDEMLDFEFDETQNLVHAFLDWVETNDVEFLQAEKRIYSRRHGFVGTLDVIARVNGKLTLLDYKTSKGVYTGYKLQSAGYWTGWEEENEYLRENDAGIDGEIEQAMVVRFDKHPDKDGNRIEFSEENNIWTMSKDEYPLYRDTFLAALKVKNNLKEMNRK